MHLKNTVRAVVLSTISAMVFTPLINFGGTSTVEAASSASLRINEIHWGGSSKSSDDQWMELYNPGGAIQFSEQPFVLYKNNEPIVTVDTGSLGAGDYLVLSKYNSAGSTLGFLPNRQTEKNLFLSKSDTEYTIRNTEGLVVDQVAAGLAGSEIASMSRISPFANGMAKSSWFTSMTHGKGLDSRAIQYGTPGGPNIELAQPQNIAINPQSPAIIPNNIPVITGKFVLESTNIVPTVVQAFYQSITPGISKESQKISVNAAGEFVISDVELRDGLYRISVKGTDSSGNSTVQVPVAITGSPQNVYVVNTVATIFEKPTLDQAYVRLTKEPEVTLTGKAPADSSLVVYINGDEYGIDIPTIDRTFSLSVPLVPNSLNRIEVRARYGSDTSEPVIAEVTHDNTTPLFEYGKIQINPQVNGSSDSIQGLPGAALGAVLAEVYSDKGMKNLIGMTVVNPDGSFGPIAIGDDMYKSVYLVLKDEAGNATDAIALDVSSAIIAKPVTSAPVYNGMGGNVPSGSLISSIVNTPLQTEETPPVREVLTPQIAVVPPTTIAPSPTPSAIPLPNENGEVKSGTDVVNKNWTPWIILAVLIALAVLATAGYFYWFGAEEEAPAVATTVRGPLSDNDTPKKDVTEKGDKNPSDRPKRW